MSTTFKETSKIVAEEVGWSILDTALAPDRKSLAYSTWSDSSKFSSSRKKTQIENKFYFIIRPTKVYLISLNENYERKSIVPLRLEPESHSFTIFSLQYSIDGNEIIGGSNDACVYVYDLRKQRRTLCVKSFDRLKKKHVHLLKQFQTRSLRIMTM